MVGELARETDAHAVAPQERAAWFIKHLFHYIYIYIYPLSLSKIFAYIYIYTYT